MSGPSNRRLRDSNTGSGQKPSKALTPVSISGKNPNYTLQKSSSGKENPKSVYRAFGSGQKPVIRPVPRVEKAAVGCGGEAEPRLRLSMSSGPRGRSSSPSEFIRVFSDLKREKGSKASMDSFDRSSSKGVNGSRNSGLKRVPNDAKSTFDLGKPLEHLCQEFVKESVNKTNSSSDSVKSSSLNGSSLRGAEDLNPKADDGVNNLCEEKSGLVSESGKVEKIEKGVPLVSKRSPLDGHVKVSENLKEKVPSEGTNRFSNKYLSKLHEKLAFLEGKVKRIASDIKKTKDMLDLNNPDASKVILSDIQEKISGIEKAMSTVVNDSDTKVSASRANMASEMKEPEKTENNRNQHLSCSVKGLNSEELEDRLFPHHKLLKNRKTLKASSGASQTDKPGRELNAEKDLSSVEENSIALEFLASLDKEQSKVTIKGEMELSEDKQMDGEATYEKQHSSKMLDVKDGFDRFLTSDETLDDFDDQENRQETCIDEEDEDTCIYQLNEIGQKTSTGGWFVSEGEAVLLAHDDGSCSYYDIANCEEKSVYKPPGIISPNMWRDCWIIRAPGADGCSGRYVVVASAGNASESGFCSWDFYSKDIQAFHIEDGANTTSRTALRPLCNNTMFRRDTLSGALAPENHRWWYKPCGPLIVSTASSQKAIKVFDIRDGEEVMKWEVHKPVLAMDYSSPLQWRNRGKLVIAESETISVWDVNSLSPEALLSVSSSGRKISALHINNTDAELGGGVRQRVSSSEAEGHDGVFCTADAINILDLRDPSGIGSRIPKLDVTAQSVFSRGDSIFLGCTNLRSALKKQTTSQLQQFSLRKQRLVSTYPLPESNTHLHHSAITQVWGNSNFAMGVSALGLHVFDAANDDGLEAWAPSYDSSDKARETIGPNDLYCPSFDYLGSRILLISRDRPAMWRHLL